MSTTNVRTATPPEVAAELGARLKELRLSKNITQAQLASKAGISPRALRKLEAGEGVTVETLLRALKGLDALPSLDVLLPAPKVSPMQLLNSRTRTRKRASG